MEQPKINIWVAPNRREILEYVRGTGRRRIRPLISLLQQGGTRVVQKEFQQSMDIVDPQFDMPGLRDLVMTHSFTFIGRWKRSSDTFTYLNFQYNFVLKRDVDSRNLAARRRSRLTKLSFAWRKGVTSIGMVRCSLNKKARP
ncbi:hypothetical protein M514_24339 [Trichuris suis]|uniref:Uncharacterized protein n=1 Tax=Trichuris suis TaxID=68888 RepID=A0A085N234_9BILA|nr:hypothetical protein M514_24339 [Trichuris suis]